MNITQSIVDELRRLKTRVNRLETLEPTPGETLTIGSLVDLDRPTRTVTVDVGGVEYAGVLLDYGLMFSQIAAGVNVGAECGISNWHASAPGDATVVYISDDLPPPDALDAIAGHAHRGLTDDGPGIDRFPTAYNDIYIPLAGARVPASNAPDWTAYSTNLASYVFEIDDYADLATAEALHGWIEGTLLEVHLHLVTNGLNDATERKVQYVVYFAIGDMGEVMSAEGSLTAEKTIVANQADRTHLYLDMGDIQGLTYKIGALIKLRIKRIDGSGTEPAASPFVEMVGIHYQVDALGSRNEGTKG